MPKSKIHVKIEEHLNFYYLSTDVFKYEFEGQRERRRKTQADGLPSIYWFTPQTPATTRDGLELKSETESRSPRQQPKPSSSSCKCYFQASTSTPSRVCISGKLEFGAVAEYRIQVLQYRTWSVNWHFNL